MNFRPITAVLFFIIAAANSNAQSNTTAAGGDAAGTGGSVNYSIGQVDYLVQTGSTGTVSQGVQQPFEIITVSNPEETNILLEATVYPNPVVEEIQLKVSYSNLAGMHYALYDIQGKLLEKENITSSQTQVVMKDLSSGTYLLTIFTNNSPVKQFKIIKN
jgi:hypothetical protein